MGRDLLDDKYGRWREIPIAMKRLGHQVAGVCLSYRPRPEGRFTDTEGEVEIEWTSLNLGRLRMPGLLRYWRALNNVVTSFRPDVVFAASDVFQVLLGGAVARFEDVRLIVDLSDNYESYQGSGLPGIKSVFRRVVRKADLVTCVSAPLAEYVMTEYERTGPTQVLEMGVLKDEFAPGNREEGRDRLGLPKDRVILVVAGALKRDRDIEVVFRATDRLATSEDVPPLLVVAGSRDSELDWPAIASVVDLGLLDHSEIPYLLRAADVVLVPNADSEFGRYCYPQKASEAISTQVPIVAAATPVLKQLLGDTPTALYNFGDVESAAEAIRSQLARPTLSRTPTYTWGELAGRVSDFIG